MSVYNKRTKYVRHELSTVFGDMPADELKELAADIKANGQQQPIIVTGNEIVDGWHRYNACMQAGREPVMEEYDEEIDGPLEAFVLSANLFRRQMTGEQRAQLAAAAMGYKAGKGRGSRKGVSLAQVAAAAKVSQSTAKRAVRGTKPEKKEKAAPTLEGLKTREKMLLGQLEKVREQIAALSEKPVTRKRKRPGGR